MCASAPSVRPDAGAVGSRKPGCGRRRLPCNQTQTLTVSDAFLAAQRRSIYARLDRDAAIHVRWVPALAFAGLLAMGLILYRPHAQYGPAHSTDTTARVELNARAEVNEAVNVGVNNDAQLVSDLYSMEDSVEPLAAAPIHGLFEDTAGAAQQ